MENELENEELHDIIAHNHVIQWISHARDLSFYVTVGIPYYIRRIRKFLCFSVVQQAYGTQALEVVDIIASV